MSDVFQALSSSVRREILAMLKEKDLSAEQSIQDSNENGFNNVTEI